MKRALLIAAVLLLDACASVPADRSAQDLFDDARFQPLDAPIDGEAVFALSEPMRRYLAADVARQLRIEGPQLGLIHALQASGQINLEYDAAVTRNAAEAFEARAGNCLSLVILTAALAQQLGLDVQFQEVLGEHVMSRNGDLVFYSGHVNVVLSERRSEPGADSAGMLETVIDFLPSEDRDALRVKTTSRRTVIAMYMNNRAAELLAEGNVNDAYWWARAAIVLEPRYTTTYNTLGLVYRRHGDMQEAADAFKKSTEANPNFADGYYQLGVTLIGMATVDPKTGGMIPQPGTKEALQKYVQLAPNGPNAEAAKSLIDTLGSSVTTTVGK